MTNKEYHSRNELGSTLLATLLKNARLFYQIWAEERKIEGKQLNIGSALHKIVLEPDEFDEEFAISPQVNKRTKAGREEYELFLQENEGKIILSPDDFELVEQMRDKLLKLPNFQVWLDAGIAESSYFGEIDGVGIKCRPDLLIKTKSGYIVIDLKTMGSEATPDNFAKSSANFLYPLQEAVYREVLKQNDIKVIDFIFAGVSKLDYSGAGYFRHTPEWADWGRELLDKALFKFKWCKENDSWEEGSFDFINGGFPKINNVALPVWAMHQFL